MIRRPRLGFCALLLVGLLTAPGAPADYRVEALRCEGAVDPLGVDATPGLTWRVASPERGQHQTAWRILVASSPDLLTREVGDLWDSGQVNGSPAGPIRYGGRPPAPSQPVWWSVRSWDREGRPSPWSTPATWTVGLITAADWAGAQWITAPGPERLENTLLRREFTVRPGLRRALAHVSGLGHYELVLNGTKAGNDVLSPGWTDYADSALYDTRDVTSLLREGANAAGLTLGNGMLHVVRPEGRFAKFRGSLGPQRAILHLRLDYADGTTETLVTDPSWRTRAGPITFSSIYGGEDHDARLEPSGWDQPGFDDSGWAAAAIFDGSSGVLRGTSHAAEPIAPIETHAPAQVRPLENGATLYDFGRNLSFMPRLTIVGPAGSSVRLTGGEVVNDDGTINRSTMGGAHRGSAWWSYTKATDDPETWFPKFYYLGSRYLYVETTPASPGGEPPRLQSVEQVVVHSTAAPRGRFSSSDPTLNRIRDLVRSAQRSNMVSILTDCPHREKLGWLEQNHLNGPALRYEWALDRLSVKNMRDMAEAQTHEGLVPNIAPEYTVFKGHFRAAAEWGASFILVPWQQYLFTGDDSLLREYYPAMRRYLAYLDARTSDGVLAEGLGDWYDMTLEKPGRANLTPPAVTATAHHHLCAATMAKIAAVLGHTDDAAIHQARAEQIRTEFNRAFHRPGTDTLYGSGSQTSLTLPLALDLAAPADRPAVLAALLKDIAARGHFSTGAIGTRYLFRALTDAGQADLIYRTITNPEVPGYAWQIARGATALAESWSAWTGASQNHFFLGQIVEWFYHDLVGLRPDETVPGFRHLIIRPHPVTGLTWAEAEHDTPRGRAAARWERIDDMLRFTVTIPTDAEATIELPIKDGQTARPDDPAGIKPLGRAEGRERFHLGSGRYVFTIGNSTPTK